MKRCRVVIVDTSHIVVAGLKSVLAANTEFEVIGSVRNLRELEERSVVLAPDLVLLSSQFVAEGGNLRSIYPSLQSVALVVLSVTVRDDEYMRQFDGVVNLYDNELQILQRLRKAVEKSEINPYNDSHDLSDREIDVLLLVAKGLANKEIADELNISIHTVITHRKNITHKTGIKSVAGLTVYALLNNILDQSDVVVL